MEKNTLYILINFAYILIFGILTGVVTMLNMPPKDGSLKSYRKSRYILGLATGLMTCYCVFRLILPQHHGDFIDFWMLVGFTLIFSWLTYVSFLYLIESPRYRIKHFIVDGLIPISLLLAAGIIGLLIPSTQKIIIVVFGFIYGLKCVWMLYTCMNEYRKCVKEIENYYDEGPDMRWMSVTLILSFILFIATLVVFYIDSLQLVYYSLVPFIYLYMVFKTVGFATKKIDNIRKKNFYLESKPIPEKKEKSRDISEKMRPLVEKWVNEKRYCREGLNIKEVAMEMGTNHNYLSQYINNDLNTTFQIWLNTLRIEESKILLTSKERLSIEEIGIKVGIPQNYNFSRWFKQLTEMTPFQYRRTHSSRE